MRTRTWISLTVLAALVIALAGASVQAAPRKGAPVYATPEEARQAGADFELMGEYEGTVAGDAKRKLGVQVIALGRDTFQAVFLPGGLPGAGWDGEHKILLDGTLKDGAVELAPLEGHRKYLAGPPNQFCATKTFPPKGQAPWKATLVAGKITGKTDKGETIEAKKVHRTSPTLGAKPPAGATVLLAFEPGKAPDMSAWTNTKWKPLPTGCMMVTRKSGTNATKQRFEGPWKLHIEFRSPFQPTARGQGRGNSGVFPPGGREIQVLESFGLAGEPNECGGIYKSHRPAVNMCLPPLSWQTYDVEYHPATKAGGKSSPAWYKVIHNGVVIHEKVPLGPTRTGPLNMQDHGNPVSYRNIWFVLGKGK